MADNFDNIIKSNRLLYKYVRGSHLYGLETKDSDIDYGGLFFADKNDFLGLSFNYSPQVSDAKNDETWYEIGRFCELLLKSNSTILEALFVPEDKMVVKPNPIIMPLFENRDKFITKDCFKPFVSYAIEQIKKARGLNKKIVNPILERKWPLDFCYTFKAQGSTPVKYWLEYRNLKQEYCGLVNIPNMHDIYGVYYDWGKFFEDEGITSDELISLYGVRFAYDDTPHWVDGLKNAKTDEERRIYSEGLKMCYKVNMINFIVDFYGLYDWTDVDEAIEWWYEENKKPIGYRGIVKPNSNEIRLSSVLKGEKPVCYLSYNENGYTKHCVDYKNYQDWVKVRNPKRYESNLHKNYDCYLDDETEFLTNNGWKKYDEITDDDLLGCFNDNHCIEYKHYISRTEDIYSGEIYRYDSPYIKFSITPNHKLYLSQLHRSPYNNFTRKYDKNSAKWELIKVKDYFEGKKSFYHQLLHLNNNKEDNKEFTDDFIILLGAFLSEGTYVRSKVDKRPIAIRINQSNDNPITSIMNNIKIDGLHHYCYNYEDKGKRKGNEHVWETHNKDILSKILECGDCLSTDKDIPKYVYSFSKRQFDILLDSMMAGDGSYHKKGHRIYYTYSKKMAINLNTLLRLNGYNSQLYGGECGYMYDSGFKRKDGKINGGYQVFISKFNSQYHVINKNKHWTKENVENKRIVCFETEYGTLITKNGNKLAFHGNSKNLMHSMRLITMGCELAEGKGLLLDRNEVGDRDFLMKIRNHQFEYDELMEFVIKKQNEMNEAMKTSTLPEHIDIDLVNDILIDIRKNLYKL